MKHCLPLTSRRLPWLVFLIGALTFSTGVGVALAHHADSIFPTSHTPSSCIPNTYFCQTDNEAVSAYIESSITGRAGITGALNGSYDTTDLTISYSGPVYSGSSETDIIFRLNAGLPSGTLGRAFCDDPVSLYRCDQHYAEFKYASPTKAVACHEIGHTVGLTHPTEADPASSASDTNYQCMQNAPGSFEYLGTHNVALINNTY